jgi:diaminohydroxyphosphoribosylaminopyrimidine deaminase/5-amino-6-(5-phosphoribosylamino)uracil reductase
LELAEKAKDKTYPNPTVGAVLVYKNSILSENYHKKPGEEHAEILVLKNVEKKILEKSELYVTLEPCCHKAKRTPPCTKFLINSGIKKICIATKDPNPQVNGRGISLLQKAGIKVRVGLLEEKARKQNPVFFKNMTSLLPYVTLKMAMSLDGKIATVTGSSRWITSELARKFVHNLRSVNDGIITSSSTVIKDNPDLGVRLVKGKDPLRIIIDRHLKTSHLAAVYRDKNVLVITTAGCNKSNFKYFKNKGIEMMVLANNFKLAHLLAKLRQRGLGRVLIEAGGEMAASFIKGNLIDRFCFIYGSKLIGSDGISSIAKLGIKNITQSRALEILNCSLIGDNVLIEAIPKK